ncbi:MAG: ferritin family protein [Candidatus Saccharicenans sp.]|nr:ferritin family protein [Candidatus Saccharicenans sp.]MDI6848766.1 ferritin family protein [Candidatus Saccharicenans sp.]
MNYSNYSLPDLLLTAYKSEIEARDFYKSLAEPIKNFFLKDRILFLSAEEEKHRQAIENLYRQQFSEKEMLVPEKSPVPLPEIKIEKETLPVSEVLWAAMAAEKAAHDFYLEVARHFATDSDQHKLLIHIASMEMGHYQLLNLERENALRTEDFEVTLPMVHVGP